LVTVGRKGPVLITAPGVFNHAPKGHLRKGARIVLIEQFEDPFHEESAIVIGIDILAGIEDANALVFEQSFVDRGIIPIPRKATGVIDDKRIDLLGMGLAKLDHLEKAIPLHRPRRLSRILENIDDGEAVIRCVLLADLALRGDRQVFLRLPLAAAPQVEHRILGRLVQNTLLKTGKGFSIRY